MSRNTAPKLLPDDESAVPLLTSSHRNYAGISDTTNDGKHEHSITVIESDATSMARVSLPDAKEEKISAQQEKPTIASLSLYRDNIKKCIGIIEAAIDQVNNDDQVMQRRQTRLGKRTFFIVEFILAAALGGLIYGCSQECHDKNPATPGYVIGLVAIGVSTLMLMWMNQLFQCCFDFKPAKHSFSVENQRQLQSYFNADMDLNSPKEIGQLRGLLYLFTHRLETIERDLGQAIQRYQSRLAFFLGDRKQEPTCRLHYAFFNQPQLAHIKPLSRLIFEAAGIIAVAPQNGLVLRTDQAGNSPDTKASAGLATSSTATTEDDIAYNDSEDSIISSSL